MANSSHDNPETDKKGGPHRVFSVGAFLLVTLFVWLIFDNLALGILFGLMAAGGLEVAQRTTDKKTKFLLRTQIGFDFAGPRLSRSHIRLIRQRAVLGVQAGH
uniref:Uncharacterized protein n=1 Tax=Aquisalinus luteolus TaxID=1566827 RepID=A0A8J3A4D6_9PROT|nr:hypothetical protein GCM10011355_04400 [Aquisalinus luteolus]